MTRVCVTMFDSSGHVAFVLSTQEEKPTPSEEKAGAFMYERIERILEARADHERPAFLVDKVGMPAEDKDALKKQGIDIDKLPE